MKFKKFICSFLTSIFVLVLCACVASPESGNHVTQSDSHDTPLLEDTADTDSNSDTDAGSDVDADIISEDVSGSEDTHGSEDIEESEFLAKAGSYSVVYDSGSNADIPPTYSLFVTDIDGSSITFAVEYSGLNASPIYQTCTITTLISENAAAFEWNDSWGNSGTGKLMFTSDSAIITMVVTTDSGNNRSTLERDALELPYSSRLSDSIMDYYRNLTF